MSRTHTHTRTRTRTHTHTHTHTHTQLRTMQDFECGCVCVHVCGRACVGACVRACVRKSEGDFEGTFSKFDVIPFSMSVLGTFQSLMKSYLDITTSSDTPKLALIFIAQKQRYLQKNNSISIYFRKIISK